MVKMGGLVALGVTSGVGFGQVPSLTLLGIPNGRVHSIPTALSTDGQVVTGYTQLPDMAGGGTRAFMWSAAGGFNEWGSSPGIQGNTRPSAIAQTEGGLTIFGTSQPNPIADPNRQDGFRYANGAYHSLGTLAGFNRVSVGGASRDGSVAVGYVASTDRSVADCMRWTLSGGIQDIGLPRSNDAGGEFLGVSGNGEVAFGRSARSLVGGFDGFTWTQGGGWRQLPVPDGVTGGYDMTPLNANFEGSVVIGTVEPFNAIPMAVLWRNGIATSLGAFGPRWSMAAGPMDDSGNVIVGSGRDPSLGIDFAMIWLNGTAPVKLQDYLASIGVNVPSGYRLEGCSGISVDGSTIAGTANVGGHLEPFVVTIPSPAATILVGLAGPLLGYHRRRRR